MSLVSNYEERCKSTFAFTDNELTLVPVRLFPTARLLLDSVAQAVLTDARKLYSNMTIESLLMCIETSTA
jgi:hypothetical protein